MGPGVFGNMGDNMPRNMGQGMPENLMGPGVHGNMGQGMPRNMGQGMPENMMGHNMPGNMGQPMSGQMGSVAPPVSNINAANIVPLPNIPHLSQLNDDGSLKPQSNFSTNDPEFKRKNDESSRMDTR